MISSDPILWVTFIFIIMVWSFLWKENILFRIAENIFIGVSAANMVLTAIKTITNTGIGGLQKGEFLWIFPLAFGVMMYSIYFKDYKWVARMPTSLLVAIGTGLAVRTMVDAQLVRQIKMTILPLIQPNVMNSVDNILIVVMTASCILYFVFSEKTSKYLGPFRKFARYVIMMAMGAGFGGAVLLRSSMMLESLITILYDLFGL